MRIGTSQQLFEPFLDNNNKAQDYQRADFDTTHVFNFEQHLPAAVRSGQEIPQLRRLRRQDTWRMGDLRLGQWQSGAPITFVDTRGTLNRTGRSSRQTPVSTLDNQG